jgi:hypothetical protein
MVRQSLPRRDFSLAVPLADLAMVGRAATGYGEDVHNINHRPQKEHKSVPGPERLS